jgi:hypothetical protein
MTADDIMERDLRTIMQRIRRHGSAEVYLIRSHGVLRLRHEGKPHDRLAFYAILPKLTYRDIADMIREDVDHAVEKCP